MIDTASYMMRALEDYHNMTSSGLMVLSTTFILRGMACVFLCLLFLVWPKVSLFIIQAALWIFLIIEGGLDIYVGSRLRTSKVGFWFVPFLTGLAHMAGGFYFLAHLDRMTFVALALLAGLLVLRALEMVVMIVSRDVSAGVKVWLAALAILSFFFGLLILGISPDRPADLAKTIAIYTLIAGPIMLWIGFSFRREMQKSATSTARYA